jgi:sulfite exporter TauE/SafE
VKRLRPFFPDVESLVRSSRIAAGKSVRVRGVPAVLAGVALIVLATGAAKALERAATALPETLRELQALWKGIGCERRELRP